jgi:uncharacterized protein (UPF0548 family)
MQLLTRGSARDIPFSCEKWSALAPNATREDIGAGGYAHHVYEDSLSADFDIAAERLLAYKIYPPQRMKAHVCTSDGRVCRGAVIVQRISLGPVAIEAAVRVLEFERLENRVGFAYVTLPGHIELGIAAFAVSRIDGGLNLRIETWSRPGHWSTKVAGPFSRLIQRRSTEEAIAWFKTSVS